MAKTSNIEWTDSTFNPWMGCTQVSPACDDCYAARSTAVRRFGVGWGPGNDRRRTGASNWALPVKWNAERFMACGRCGWRGPLAAEVIGCGGCGSTDELHDARRRVFSASLADWLDNEVPIEWLVDFLDLIRRTPNLDWLLLTKRIGNFTGRINKAIDACNSVSLREWLAEWLARYAPSNVWLGATVVNQAEADRDVPKLLAVPARVRFLSMEPLLGPVSLETIHNTDFGEGQPYLHPLIGRVSDGHGDGCNAPAIDWVIVGGESGHKARPMHPDWVRSLRDQCEAAGVPFLFKQWGEWAPETLRVPVGGPLEPAPNLIYLADKDGERQKLVPMVRVGKKAAGRLLNGRTWDGFPS